MFKKVRFATAYPTNSHGLTVNNGETQNVMQK